MVIHETEGILTKEQQDLQKLPCTNDNNSVYFCSGQNLHGYFNDDERQELSKVNGVSANFED